jgi:hypothetical protein
MKQGFIIPLSSRKSFSNSMDYLNENIHFYSSVIQIYCATFSSIGTTRERITNLPSVGHLNVHAPAFRKLQRTTARYNFISDCHAICICEYMEPLPLPSIDREEGYMPHQIID